jgi:hypothetical protein
MSIYRGERGDERRTRCRSTFCSLVLARGRARLLQSPRKKNVVSLGGDTRRVNGHTGAGAGAGARSRMSSAFIEPATGAAATESVTVNINELCDTLTR